ncbi:MAG TPA: NADH:flavin oxidoreductase/NADH oxidase family protein, partial [Polyangiales bacterium]|nr:NADH:flavin oxidoreductase/NADH oxidase family protein [Polyangiales bacterium]
EPLERSPLQLANRLAKAAMSERLAGRDGAPSEALIALYRRWAGSGCGLLITGNVMIDGRAKGEPGNVVVENGQHINFLRRWASAAKEQGARVFVQINHPGRQAPRGLNRELVGPSAIAVKAYGAFARPRALSGDEIKDIIGRYARTACLLREAGFDGVQVHGAHGYLVSQFLSPRANTREDEWGGDASRRRRFLYELLQTLRAAVGADYPISLKLNSADFQRGGFDEAESMAVVESLPAGTVDLLEISGGTYEAAAMMGATRTLRSSTRQREAYFLDYATKVRARAAMPLMLTGGFRSRLGMEQALESGAIDVVGLARPLVVEPEFGQRLLANPSASISLGVRRSGIRQLDGALETVWHGMQLARIGNGQDPDRSLGVVRALAGYMTSLR